MKRIFCDVCGKEITEESDGPGPMVELHRRITNHDAFLVMPGARRIPFGKIQTHHAPPVHLCKQHGSEPIIIETGIHATPPQSKAT